jgi:hypothetical protein
VHLFLTIITLGLWLVSWMAIYIGNQLRPWRCQQCGWYKPMARPRASLTVEANAHENEPKES